MTEPNKRIAIVCETCGSDHVTRDAWAEWDVTTQEWTLGAVYDYAFCHKCEEGAHLAEIALKPAPIGSDA